MTGDVLEEHPLGVDLEDDPGDVGPEVAGIVCAPALSCCAERLTRIASQHGVDRAAVGPSVEGLDVIPDRGWREVSGALTRDDGVSGVGFDLDPCAGVKTRLGKHDAKIEATGSTAEAEPVSGTWHHVISRSLGISARRQSACRGSCAWAGARRCASP